MDAESSSKQKQDPTQAPPGGMSRMRNSSTSYRGGGGGSHRRCRNICVVSAIVLIVIVIVLVIVGVTVFKVKHPVTTIDTVSLQDFQISFAVLPPISVKLNLTLATQVSISNPNKLGFKYTDSSAYLDYGGDTVGQATIPAGTISAGQTLPMNLTLTVMADRLLSNVSVLFSDVTKGTLPLTTYTRISGKVTILFVKIHVVSYTTCNLLISVADRNISSNDCTYKTKL